MLLNNLFCFVVFITYVNSDESFLNEWKNFKKDFKKQYSSPMEEQQRMEIFANELKRINAFNAGNHSYTQGINYYSDWTFAEFQTLLYQLPSNDSNSLYDELTTDSPIDTKDAPDKKDWVKEKMVVKVKSQGRCGSCWAFAAIASLESMQVIMGNVESLTELSEQHLVDCHKKDCGGGFHSKALSYIKQNGGISKAKDYKYTSSNGKAGTCKAKKDDLSGQVKEVKQIRSENDLKNVVGNIGPVAFGICFPQSLSKYKSGVYKSDDCNKNCGGHAMVIVGYGKDPKEGDFWLIKNSHGTRYGENGYLRLQRGKDRCKIANRAYYPVV